ncbi:MAG: hypothetical protein AAGA68_22120 [Pseudomonadota bacterium]
MAAPLKRLGADLSPVAYAEVSHFHGVTQRASRLCWAACVQARLAMDATHREAPPDQAALAFRFVPDPGAKEDLAWLSARPSHPCNQPMPPQRMAAVWHALGYASARRLELPIADLGGVLLAQLRRNCPVQVRIEGTHAVLVVAYQRSADGREGVFIMDPAPAAAGGWQRLGKATTWLDLWIDLERPHPAPTPRD